MLSTKNKVRLMSVFAILAMLFSFANVSFTGAAAGITVDQSVSGPSTSLIISTSQANELILIAANGWPAPRPAPTVTVDGSPAGLIAFAADASFDSGGAFVFQFVAPSAGTHTIVVIEGGYSDPYYLNFAVSLLGATNAGLTFTAASFPNAQGMGASITTSTSNEYVFATSTHNTYQKTAGILTWHGSPVIPTLLQTLYVGSGIDSSIVGFNATTPGTYVAKVEDSLGGAGGGNIILVAVKAAAPSKNRPPTANAGGPYLGAVNTSIQFDGSGSSDPDGDSLTYAWDFGDSGTDTGVMPTHSYSAAGIYDVCLTVNDGTVLSAQSCTLAVVYDPNGGFVTGGGWINSPEGAYTADTSLTGKANFGFIAKYKQGANLPGGDTEFQFKAGDLNFHSSSYQWLVVAGARAQFKGEGTINGAGHYGFMLTAIDGQINGGGGVDKFRIKIWDMDNGDMIVYDNQMAGADGDDPTTVLGGGSIVIHK